MKTCLFVATLTVLQLGSSSRITSDLRCKNDRDCIFRSRNQLSYCSFASGEYRDNIPVGWCHTRSSGSNDIIKPGPAPIPQPVPELILPVPGNPKPPTSGWGDESRETGYWDVKCDSDRICHANGFTRCYLEGGYCEGRRRPGNGGIIIGGDEKPTSPPQWKATESPPTWTTTSASVCGGDELPGPGNNWDYTCGSDCICKLRGFSYCSFRSGEFRDRRPRGWCQ